ncbi:MAG TPA: hypothetical protein ENF81_07695 [Thermotogaceae bacterium]|nr:hypothetical protein [Thermotogaceae bacterium]
MIFNLAMNFFQLDSLKSFSLRWREHHTTLSERCCKSLKSVDRDIQSAKNNMVLESMMNGVDVFKIG